jgi:hypothetical protein
MPPRSQRSMMLPDGGGVLELGQQRLAGAADGLELARRCRGDDLCLSPERWRFSVWPVSVRSTDPTFEAEAWSHRDARRASGAPGCC